MAGSTGIKQGFTEESLFRFEVEWDRITTKLKYYNHLDHIKIVPHIPDKEDEKDG